MNRAARLSEPAPPRRSRALSLVLLALVLWGPLVGCLQQISLQPDRAMVTGRVVVDQGQGGRAGVRIDIAKTAPRTNQSRDLLLTSAGFTDEDGSFLIPTQDAGSGFFAVARHPDYEIEAGPLGDLVLGQETPLENFFPLFDLMTGDATPVTTPPTLFPKQPGRVKFMFLATEQNFGRLVNVEVLGDFNGFSKTDGLLTLFDDGSQLEQEDDDGNVFFSGDAMVNDGVYVRVVTGIPPGPLRYNVILNRNLVIRDAFEESHERMVDENNLPVIRSVVTVR